MGIASTVQLGEVKRGRRIECGEGLGQSPAALAFSVGGNEPEEQGCIGPSGTEGTFIYTKHSSMS